MINPSREAVYWGCSGDENCMSSIRKAIRRKACSSVKPETHSVRNISLSATAAPTRGESCKDMRAR